jgi:hypothetical protein
MTSFSGRANLPRGLRDNNPGNIRPSIRYQWNGQVGTENNYVVFVDIEHGLRAMCKDLMSKINRGLNTLNKYIPVYAPPSDNNNTQGYIDRVSKSTGIEPKAILDTNKTTMVKLVKAHIAVEIGGHYAELITDDMINHGVDLALND